MPKRTPTDAGFIRKVRQEIQGIAGERLLFIDTQNEVREAVYVTEFNSGEPQRVRQRLEDQGVLKGVVHVSASHLGDTGPRISIVEYLPEKATYDVYYAPSQVAWGTTNADTQSAYDKYEAFWAKYEGKESDTQE